MNDRHKAISPARYLFESGAGTRCLDCGSLEVVIESSVTNRLINDPVALRHTIVLKCSVCEAAWEESFFLGYVSRK